MNRVVNENSLREVIQLLAQVREKLNALNDSLCNIRDPNPDQPLQKKQLKGSPGDYHLRYVELDRAFTFLQTKLLADHNGPTPWPGLAMQAAYAQQFSEPVKTTEEELPQANELGSRLLTDHNGLISWPAPTMQATYTQQLPKPVMMTDEQLPHLQSDEFEKLLSTSSWPTTMDNPGTASGSGNSRGNPATWEDWDSDRHWQAYLTRTEGKGSGGG